MAFFERLAHGFEHAALELQQFVEKKYPVVSQRDFAWGRIDIPAQQPSVRGRVVRSTERTPGDQGLPGGFGEPDFCAPYKRRNLKMRSRLLRHARRVSCGGYLIPKPQ